MIIDELVKMCENKMEWYPVEMDSMGWYPVVATWPLKVAKFPWFI